MVLEELLSNENLQRELFYLNGVLLEPRHLNCDFKEYYDMMREDIKSRYNIETDDNFYELYTRVVGNFMKNNSRYYVTASR